MERSLLVKYHPAVAAVRGVMQKMSTGDEIIINGETGAVILPE